jgi:non-structural maintenance of chromosomes element 1
MQTSRPCPGCGTEWPCQDDEADGNDDANELIEKAAQANQS